MKYALGIDVGADRTTASILKWDSAFALPLTAGEVLLNVSSMAFLTESTELLFGTAATEAAATAPHRVIRDVSSRIGDQVPIAVDEWTMSAECVLAQSIRWVVLEVIDRVGDGPSAIAVTCPTGWGSYRRTLLAGALTAVGLSEVALHAEGAAAAAQVADQLPAAADTVLVYHLSRGSFQATLVRRSGDDFAVIGRPQCLDAIAGADFEQAVLDRALRSVGAGPTAARAAAGTPSDMVRLRAACADAVTALSIETETSITVGLQQETTTVRLVRAEFEDLIRDGVAETVDVAAQVAGSAGCPPESVDAVLLVGAASRIPLIAQLLSVEFDRPILLAADPEATISLGAATIAARLAAQPVTDLPVTDLPGAVEPVSAPVEEPIPAPVLVASATGPRHHRRRRTSGYWVRSSVLVATLAGLLLVGSSLAAPENSAGLPSAVPGPAQFQPADPVFEVGDSGQQPGSAELPGNSDQPTYSVEPTS